MVHRRAPLLGSPAVNDATIHVLQACVPHRRLLPVGCARLVVNPGPAVAVRLSGAELAAGNREYVWDVEARDGAGRLLVRWDRLVLRDVGPLPIGGPWPAALLAVYLERSARELGLDPGLQVELSGPGRPGPDRVRSHLGDLTLAAHSGRSATVDWEPVEERPELAWRRLLGGTLFPLLAQVQARTQESLSIVATRVWTAVECLSKAGHPPITPLTLTGSYDGGWVGLRDGSYRIASLVTSVAGVPGPVAIALLTGEPDADRHADL